MSVHHHRFSIELVEEFGHADVTAEVERALAQSGIGNGVVTIAAVGSTGAVTTIEYEPGALQDLRAVLERLAPVEGAYAHNERWQDGNGFSHVRSALLKTGISVPVVDGALALGTWQQVVVLNFDNRPRNRKVIVSIVGE